MIYATPQATEFWCAVKRRGQHSRALAAAKFVDFPDTARDDAWRRRSCDAVCAGNALSQKLDSWRGFCGALPAGEGGLLFARLMARLIVNQAGGVLENGGVCLDRNSGLPFIPGSAVKGCARKAAIIRLRETREPGLAADLLERIAWIFGWTEQAWSGDSGRQAEEDVSDFCYACGWENWSGLRRDVAARLARRVGLLAGSARSPAECPASFAGTMRFLPAFPWNHDPGIDLDIVTPHHTAYYGGDPAFAGAPDVEEPKPNVFPAVSCKGSPVFVFPLAVSPGSAPGDLAWTKELLREGLTLWGIGAKTAAGYGWFESSPELDEEMLAQERQRREETRRAEQARLVAAQAEAAAAEARQRKALLAALPPEQRADQAVAEWDDRLFMRRVENFVNAPKKGGPADDQERLAIVRALAGARQALWQQFRNSAQRGPAANTLAAIYRFCKEKGIPKP